MTQCHLHYSTDSIFDIDISKYSVCDIDISNYTVCNFYIQSYTPSVVIWKSISFLVLSSILYCAAVGTIKMKHVIRASKLK